VDGCGGFGVECGGEKRDQHSAGLRLGPTVEARATRGKAGRTMTHYSIFIDGKQWLRRPIPFASVAAAERWARQTFLAGCMVRIETNGKRPHRFLIPADKKRAA
jgi:hypothetical protein